MELAAGAAEASQYFAPRSAWCVGIDIGQASDPTALCALEHTKWIRRDGSPERLGWRCDEAAAEKALKPRDTFCIRALLRLPLGMSYVDQCARLGALLGDPRLHGARAFLDATGVGKPVSDLFRRYGIKHTPVWISGGRDEQPHGADGLVVPKLHLVSRLQACLHAGELKIAKALPEAAVFVRELREFRVSFSEAGNMSFGARQGAHDDLVLAAALAVYGASRPVPLIGPFPMRWATG